MTCKRSKIISNPDTTYSVLYNYAFLPMLILYLCLPIVILVKYLLVDIMKTYARKSKTELQIYARDKNELIKLKLENAVLKEQMHRRQYARDMLNVLKNYEYTLQQFTEEHKNTLAERDALQEMLSAMEDNFHILNLKYDKAKEIIDGLEKNEESLRTTLNKWEEAVQSIEEKYQCFKEYAVDKIDYANSQIKSTDTEYKHEICKLKTKVVESQLRISELELQITYMCTKEVKKKRNIFEPLVTNIH